MPKLEPQIEFPVGIFSHERGKHLNVRRGVLQVIESLALRRRLDAMGPNARPQRTVTPVERSDGVSPTPNPRGVEGRDLLLCPA